MRRVSLPRIGIEAAVLGLKVESSLMGLLVLRPGLFSTVQDRGRFGYRAFGVPPGGAFDEGSADLANAMLDNPPDAAVLELTLFGGTFEALGPIALALAGAPMAATARNGRRTQDALGPGLLPALPRRPSRYRRRRPEARGRTWRPSAAGERSPSFWGADRVRNRSDGDRFAL